MLKQCDVRSEEILMLEATQRKTLLSSTMNEETQADASQIARYHKILCVGADGVGSVYLPADEVIRETSHLRLERVDEMAVLDALFHTEQNGGNIESPSISTPRSACKPPITESDDVIFTGFTASPTEDAFEMSKNLLEKFFEPAWDAIE